MTEKLYASILELDRKAVKHLGITDPYSLHRVVYSLFPDVRTDDEKRSGKPSGIVYADQGGDFFTRKILILSNRVPASCVESGYGAVLTREIPRSFLGYDYYRFKVVVNPCIRRNATRKLEPVRGREAIAHWFCDRSQRNWGFVVLKEHLQVDSMDVLRFTAKNRHRITMSRATVQGVLKVVERDRFMKSFAAGLGRGRAFGCGLLQIVPQKVFANSR